MTTPFYNWESWLDCKNMIELTLCPKINELGENAWATPSRSRAEWEEGMLASPLFLKGHH